MTDGWTDSANAWIADMGEGGDFGRRFVLDRPMLARVEALAPQTVLDVGCGEGRFCRMLASRGITVVGVDPTVPLIEQARRQDPGGRYHVAGAEALPFEDVSFDLVVAYLSMIDMPDLNQAIPEMVRMLKPGGRLLIGNLNGFNTAAQDGLGWKRLLNGKMAYAMDHYLTEASAWIEWRGIRIRNHHRPLSTYMRMLLEQGLVLTHFDEPAADPAGPAERVARYNRAPWFLVMEWARPTAP